MTGAQVPPSFVNKPPRGWLHSDHLFAKVIIIIIIIPDIYADNEPNVLYCRME